MKSRIIVSDKFKDISRNLAGACIEKAVNISPDSLPDMFYHAVQRGFGHGSDLLHPFLMMRYFFYQTLCSQGICRKDISVNPDSIRESR